MGHCLHDGGKSPLVHRRDQSLAVAQMNVADLQSELHQASLIKDEEQHEKCDDVRRMGDTLKHSVHDKNN